MKPLKKSERQRFESVCCAIRKALNLEHLERQYEFSNEGTTIASTTVFNEGWRLFMRIRPQFWEHEYEQQCRFLIHEHIHVALHPLHQAQDTIAREWVAAHNSSQVEEIGHKGSEIAVDHLTEAIYRLIRDRLE